MELLEEFEDVWSKMMLEEDITEFEATIIGGSLCKLAYEVDSKFLHELQYTSTDEEDFSNKVGEFRDSETCFMYFWEEIVQSKYAKQINPYIAHTMLDLCSSYKHIAGPKPEHNFRRGELVVKKEAEEE